MKTGNEPAMPLNAEAANGYGATGELSAGCGMTIRQYFAAQAMIGLLFRKHDLHPAEMVAEKAFLLADAMIAENNKNENDKAN